MNPRAIEILNKVDVIACEDTRTSGSLLKHFDIHNRLIAYHNFNEESSANGILELLRDGKNIALISDAGYPLINDPGQKIVTLATSEGFNVVPVSGASAFKRTCCVWSCSTAIYLYWFSSTVSFRSC